VNIVTVEAALRQRIKELQRYRKAGLRWLRSAKLYDKLTATQPNGQPHLLNDVIRYIQVCTCLPCFYCLFLQCMITELTSPPQSHLGRVHRHPSLQIMHSSAVCAICAVSTAYKSSYSAAGMLNPYHFSPFTVDTLVPNLNLYTNPNPSYLTNPTTSAS